MINKSYQNGGVIFFAFLFSCGCQPEIVRLGQSADSFVSPNEFANLRSYEVCCGTVRGYLLDSSKDNAVDIWIKRNSSDFFLPLTLATHGKDYTDITNQCLREVSFDEAKKQLNFATNGRPTAYVQFSETLRTATYGILMNERKEATIIVLEIGGESDTKSKIYIASVMKNSLKCQSR